MLFTTSIGEIISIPSPKFSSSKVDDMAPARTEEDGFDIAIKQVPVTEQRRPFIQKKGDERLSHTGEDLGHWVMKLGGRC